MDCRTIAVEGRWWLASTVASLAKLILVSPATDLCRVCDLTDASASSMATD